MISISLHYWFFHFCIIGLFVDFISCVDECSIRRIFKIVGTIHRGGQSVLKVAHLDNEIPVIIKFPKHKSNFQSELYYLDLFSDIDHVSELICVDYEEMALVMKYYQEGDLRNINESYKMVLDVITMQLVEAIFEMHQKGIIHMDIKPENILLEDGNAYIADFGLSRKVEKARPMNGTRKTMAPEVLYPSKRKRGSSPSSKKITFAADWWSLGVTLFYMYHKVYCPNHEYHYPYKVEGRSMNWIRNVPSCMPDKIVNLLFGDDYSMFSMNPKDREFDHKIGKLLRGEYSSL